MKKLIAIAAALLIGSGLYAKQYIYSLKANATVLRYSTAQKLQEGLERALFDLIIRGNKIILITPTTADGYTIGYTIIYEDNKPEVKQ